ncbi:MAG TPA: MFS transporter [Roseiarcus sp.]|nr:MFS transporter [Roseiarcus sp.]
MALGSPRRLTASSSTARDGCCRALATGLFLVTALPPVVQRFPSGRLPVTAAAINIGFFGATVLGPLLGGVAAQGHAWRWFYIALALLGGLTFVLAVLTLPDQEPTNPGARLDAPGLALGFAAAALPFWAVGELAGVSFASPLFAAPLGVGLVCLVAMLLVEYHKKEPLSPVKQMWHTFPIIGTLAAMVGGAAYFTFLVLAQELLLHVGHVPPLAAGLAFWPQVAAVILAAVLLGLLLRTRWLPVLVLAGMILLVAGGGLVLVVRPSEGSSVAMLSAAGLLGLGAGATVSPGLFMASLALPSRIIGRTFALVELVRSVADYILAPVMLKVAHVASGPGGLNAAGVREAIWITLAVTMASALAGVVLFLLGGASLPRPDIEAWLKQNRPAIGSPKLAESVRERI